MRNQSMGYGYIRGAIALVLVWCAAPLWATCRIPVTVIGQNASVVVHSEVVTTPESRAQGLMYRTEMADDAAMLFIYPSPQRTAFWMKNTYLPLDIMFFDGAKELLSRYVNTVPHDLTPLFGGETVQYVLEVPAHFQRRFDVGDILEIAFENTAARKCGS